MLGTLRDDYGSRGATVGRQQDRCRALLTGFGCHRCGRDGRIPASFRAVPGTGDSFGAQALIAVPGRVFLRWTGHARAANNGVADGQVPIIFQHRCLCPGSRLIRPSRDFCADHLPGSLQHLLHFPIPDIRFPAPAQFTSTAPSQRTPVTWTSACPIPMPNVCSTEASNWSTEFVAPPRMPAPASPLFRPA